MTRTDYNLGTENSGFTPTILMNNLYFEPDNEPDDNSTYSDVSSLTDPLDWRLEGNKRLDDIIHMITRFGTIHNTTITKRTSAESALLSTVRIVKDAPTRETNIPVAARAPSLRQKRVTFLHHTDDDDSNILPSLTEASDDEEVAFFESCHSTTTTIQLRKTQEEYDQERTHWNNPNSTKSVRARTILAPITEAVNRHIGCHQ